LEQRTLASDDWKAAWELVVDRQDTCSACSHAKVRHSSCTTSIIYAQDIANSVEASIDAAAKIDAQLTGGEIHDTTLTACHQHGCKGVYVTTQTARSMPSLLFVEIEGNNTDRKVAVEDANRIIAGVEYELIAVLYNETNSHFFAQVKINGDWYMANDNEAQYKRMAHCSGREFGRCHAGAFKGHVFKSQQHMIVYLRVT
jgi:hypothetical protein